MAKRVSSDELSDREKIFVAAYIRDPNGTQAAIAAGYSERSAHVQAARLIKKAKVRKAIDDATAKAAEDAGLTRRSVLRQLQRMVEADLARCFDRDGRLLPIHEMPEDIRAAISAVEVDEITVGDQVVGQTRKVKLWDKNSAIEKAMKHLGLLRERLEHVGAGGGPIQTETRDYGALLRRYRPGGK